MQLTYNFNRHEQNVGQLVTLRAITRIIRPIIGNLVNHILESYHTLMLPESSAYVVSAVWGAPPGAPLDTTQKLIKQRIDGQVNRIHTLVQSELLSEDSRFAIDFLIRELLVANILHRLGLLRAMLKSRLESGDRGQDQPPYEWCLDIETAGNA